MHTVQALLVMDGYFLGDGTGVGDAAPAPSHCAAAATKLSSLSTEVAYTADSTTWRLRNRSTMTGAHAALPLHTVGLEARLHCDSCAIPEQNYLDFRTVLNKAKARFLRTSLESTVKVHAGCKTPDYDISALMSACKPQWSATCECRRCRRPDAGGEGQPQVAQRALAERARVLGAGARAVGAAVAPGAVAARARRPPGARPEGAGRRAGPAANGHLPQREPLFPPLPLPVILRRSPSNHNVTTVRVVNAVNHHLQMGVC